MIQVKSQHNKKYPCSQQPPLARSYPEIFPYLASNTARILLLGSLSIRTLCLSQELRHAARQASPVALMTETAWHNPSPYSLPGISRDAGPQVRQTGVHRARLFSELLANPRRHNRFHVLTAAHFVLSSRQRWGSEWSQHVVTPG